MTGIGSWAAVAILGKGGHSLACMCDAGLAIRYQPGEAWLKAGMTWGMQGFLEECLKIFAIMIKTFRAKLNNAFKTLKMTAKIRRLQGGSTNYPLTWWYLMALENCPWPGWEELRRSGISWYFFLKFWLICYFDYIMAKVNNGRKYDN